MKRKAVILDLDGTLLDSVGLIIDSWQEALSCLGVKIPKEKILDLEGIAASEKSKMLLPKKKWNKADELLAIRRCVEMRDFSRIRPFPGVSRMLDGLDRGLKVAVASASQRRRVNGLLETFRLKRRVNAIVGREDYARGRPAPDILLAAAKKLRVNPQECVAVGDTKYDVEAARSAGCISVAVLSGTHSKKAILSRRPDFVIRKITELPRLLRALIIPMSAKPIRSQEGFGAVWNGRSGPLPRAPLRGAPRPVNQNPLLDGELAG